MYRIPIATHNRLMRGEVPVLYLKIETHMGTRAYAKKTITAAEIAGSLGCLARVLSFGSFERTLVPLKNDLLTAFSRKQQQHISVELDNADNYFSALLGSEPFISRPLSIYIGFEDEAVANHIRIFKGIISEVSVMPVLTLEASEKSSSSPTGVTLDDTFYLPTAEQYQFCKNIGDKLPIVYGDNRSSGPGNLTWKAPCIDTENYVYCFAAHPVATQTAMEVQVFSGGVLKTWGSDYTFNPSHYFEPPDPPPAIHVTSDNIATITFTSDQGDNEVTCRGLGKIFLPISLLGEELIDNPIDVISDFLCEENDFTSDLFEATAKAKAQQIIDATYPASLVDGTRCAGVITQDATYWEIITSIMASFLGSAYLNGEGKLVLEVDDGTTTQYSAGTPTRLPKQETTLVESRQRMENIINQCPSELVIDPILGSFYWLTDIITHRDGASQGIYGIRKPKETYKFYWTRRLSYVWTAQDIIVTKFGFPLYEIEVDDITLKRIHVDVGDPVIYSAEGLYGWDGAPLTDATWRVISVRPDFARGKITFRLLQLPIRTVVPPVAPTPWDGILRLTIPDAPSIAAPTLSTIEEAPLALPHVVAHLTFTGADESTDITDASGKEWTANGDAQISGNRLLLDGDDSVSTPDHADWNFGTSDLDISFDTEATGDMPDLAQWLFLAQYDGSYNGLAAGFARSDAGYGGTVFSFAEIFGGVPTANAYFTSISAILDGVHDYWRLTRRGNVFTLYRNGAAIDTQTVAATFPDSSQTVVVGAGMVGLLDNFRLIKGSTLALDLPAVPTVAVAAIVHAPVDTCTISNAAPAVVTCVGNGLAENTNILFKTTGGLPAPLIAGNQYYVKNAGDSFNVSLTPGGSAIDTTTAGSGVHTLWAEP